MPHTPQNPRTFGELPPSAFPGERLGLPESGVRSVARVGRRITALVIFAIMQLVFIPTIGGSIGHRLCGMRLMPLTGGWVGLWRPVVRTVLLCVVVPALVWDSDQRGFHDKVAGTVLLRVR